jgi:hypothetical protein
MLDKYKRKIIRFIEDFSKIKLFVLSIKACKTKPYNYSAPGFSPEDIHDNQSTNYSYQLFLQPYGLYIFQFCAVILLSFVIIIPFLLTSFDWKVVMGIILLFLGINLIYSTVIWFVFSRKPIFHNIWDEYSDSYLKKWFRQIPHKVVLTKPSNKIWFSGRVLSTIISNNSNNIYQKDIYLKSLYAYSVDYKASYDTLIYGTPIIPGGMFFILIFFIDLSGVNSCNYDIVSFELYLFDFFWCASVFLYISYIKKHIGEILEYNCEPDSTEVPTIPAYFIYLYRKNYPATNNDNDNDKIQMVNVNTDNTTNNDDLSNRYKYIKYKTIIVILSTIFTALVGLSNIQSMTNGSCKCDAVSKKCNHDEIKDKKDESFI